MIFAPKENADRLMEVLRRQPYFADAAIIGEVCDQEIGRVFMQTEVGTETYLPQPGNELLPRIC